MPSAKNVADFAEVAESLPPLLKKAEAAQALRCSTRTVDRLIARGALVRAPGGLVTVTRKSLVEYLGGAR